MASYFQSFRQSLMPKQLLRFALARLDLLDEKALDLENLDFALGRNTILEFRDVGLVLQKLEKLLGLPPTFSIQKAKIFVLRVTIPMDFYTSPIIAEVDGVDVQLKILSQQEVDQQRSKKRRRGRASDDVVPTAADLAQSFLETQPVSEKKELEQALVAESQDLGASVTMSEPESDDESSFGTGQALSLPAFLTDFLQGIVDRMQIRIQGVSFQVDTEVPVDVSSQTPELVTFQLSLDKVDVEGVTTPGPNAEDGPEIVHKEGKRHVLLDNIRASLITEANVFSSLAPSPSMLSSQGSSQSPVATETPAFPSPEAMMTESISSASVTSNDFAQLQAQMQDSEAALNIPYDFEQPDTLNEYGEPNSPASTPRASLYQDMAALDIREHAKSTLVEPGASSWSAPEREAQSEPFLRPPEGFQHAAPASPAGSVHSEAASSESSGGAEDLTQSHLYSHEDAESMYMSAFSQKASVKLRGAMPGSWDEQESLSSGGKSDAAGPSSAHRQYSPPPEPQGGLFYSESGQPPDYPSQPPEKTSPTPYQPPVAEFSHDDTPIQEPHQDDVPTPRGPTRLVKEIVSLRSISVYLPSNHKHIHVITPDLGSTTPDLPGAFSVHSPEPSSPGSPAAEAPVEHPPHDPSIEIVLKPLEVRFDASIGFLLAMVMGRLLEAVQATETVESTPSKTDSRPSLDIKLLVEGLSLQFLEKLSGVADTPQRHFEKRSPDFASDVLLQANMTELKASLSSSGADMETDLTINKLTFGYVNDQVISFDRSIQMYESMAASTFLAAGQDVSVKFMKSAGKSSLKINTLPLHVKLDLSRLDETLTWFGGLSSFLNMGSSISSNPAKNAAAVPQKPKGVRFEAPTPDDRPAASGDKAEMRINGLRVDVIGRDCSVALDTSALKLINRGEGLGIHFSKIQLAGPYLRNSQAGAPIIAKIVDTRIEFLMAPREQDLERLVELITPSQSKFDKDGDEIMVDMLIRQRRKGSVLNLSVGKVSINAGRLQQLSCLPGLAEDLAKLGTVAKYLPEDDRPGLLSFVHVKSLECNADIDGRIGVVQGAITDLEVAHITVPSLIAVAVTGISITRNQTEELVATPPNPPTAPSPKPPVLRMRMVDDIEPVLKVRLNGLNVEYRVPTIMAVLELSEDTTPQDYEASLAASVANLGDHAHAAIRGSPAGSPSLGQEKSKPIKVDVALEDCLIGLNPLGPPSKLILALTTATLEVTPRNQDSVHAVLDIEKASILLIDNVSVLDTPGAPFASKRRPKVIPTPQITELCSKGFVHISQISAARAVVNTTKDENGDTQLDVELHDKLLVIETCADSTQTLIALANALAPPTPPSKEIKYKTSIVPVEDLLASITPDAFGRAEGDYDFDNDFLPIAGEQSGDMDSEHDYYGGPNDSPLNMDSQFYDEEVIHEELFDATAQSLELSKPKVEETSDGVLLSTASLGTDTSSGRLSVEEGFFEKKKSAVKGTAHRWNSKKNKYDEPNDAKIQRSPVKVGVRDVHLIWHLFDGYDWVRTREVIAKAVKEVEDKAYEKRAKAERKGDLDEEEIVGDFLFNSVYIGIPVTRDPRELAAAINQELGDGNDTESVATTSYTTSTVRPAGKYHHSRSKSLKLGRSKDHKITFELKGVNVDLVTFPPNSGETVSSIDVRVQDLVVFDHVATSTWKKFVTYDEDAGDREEGANMAHLELLNTKPVPSMPASEIVLKVSILPLRLHVDQDALDFITRFFEFKDDSTPVHASPSDVPFIQRAEVNDVPIRLDFKPKRVDYAGLRSGHTTEFMNFLILEDSRLVLRHVILYGIAGFDKLGKQLNDIWTDNVKRTQLPGVLAGLAPVRSLVNAGSGFRELIEIPLKEYQKDGRIVRSIRKGATRFAKTTGTEVVKLGAKLAIGTQYALQGAEGMLVNNPGGESSSSAASTAIDDWDEGDEYEAEEEPANRQISLYANQPLGILQGVRGAYSSLARDLAVARDAIIAVPAEVMESSNAQGAAKAVLKRAPTIIFRPAIGATKAIGQTLLGATNSLDPANRRRAEAKYKKY
ncbi:putative autophagy-related protein 2 [Triangularia verruculosa]|uniref:Autophagy-related protein 2 n=1 Tax=Triangularia verruculosa TaxID=2587418 RepID=A0AAN6XJH4_9PEZI|nr:putative autophagy-related protein 2 [Triangularia verruculosa]